MNSHFSLFAKGDLFSFGNNAYSKIKSMLIIHYLHELDKMKIAYHHINFHLIRLLETLAEAFEFHPPVEAYDQVLYRGCTSLERNGLNGIVSTSSSLKIALQFSRGTLIIIKVRKDVRWIDVAKIRAQVQKGKKRKDFENEFLLPTWEYRIIDEKIITKGSWGDEPNNHNSTTRVITVEITKTLDV